MLTQTLFMKIGIFPSSTLFIKGYLSINFLNFRLIDWLLLADLYLGEAMIDYNSVAS